MFNHDHDPHSSNRRTHYRLYMSHKGKGPIVICVQDFDYPDYDPAHFLSGEAWAKEADADAEAACANLRTALGLPN